MPSSAPIQRALLSVFDKKELLPFAQALHTRHVELLSTGGSAKFLQRAGLPVVEIATYTGFPEIMDGRLKSLHPKIYGGILGRRDQDKEIMRQHDLPCIDLVVVNFYPFVQTIADPHCTLAMATENIDIGGPALVRAAAKNHREVVVIVDPIDYAYLLEQLDNHQGEIPLEARCYLAQKAFSYTARYDATIAAYYAQQTHTTCAQDLHHKEACDRIQPSSAHNKMIGTLDHQQLFPEQLTLQLTKKHLLRYGENQHQAAALYTLSHAEPLGIAHAQQLQGKPLSYNNLLDADAAVTLLHCFTTTAACVIVKHANPCGVALGENILEAYQSAFKGDSTSAFGGIVACNRILDLTTVRTMLQQQFIEVLIAPGIEPAAAELCTTRRNLRLLISDVQQPQSDYMEFKNIHGGILIQEANRAIATRKNIEVVTHRTPTTQELTDAFFSWQVVKQVKSNAIVYARHQSTLGIGAGQMSRIDAVEIAILKAKQQGFSLSQAVMASDAFFPFRDAVDAAAAAGITCIIQPGGSKRDPEVISAANAHDIAMLYTKMRNFRH